MPDAPIVLASASPRRRELLAALGLPFEVVPSAVDETSAQTDPIRLAEALAGRKALAVAGLRPEALVIGSDTVVALDGRILGKPADETAAWAMLRSLRGRAHEVVTGVAVAHRGHVAVAHGRTEVWMRDYPDEAIAAFIASGSPFDKAGGYAIQDESFAPVDRFEGCRCNVVGLPLETLRGLLAGFGVDTLSPRVDCPRCGVAVPR